MARATVDQIEGYLENEFTSKLMRPEMHGTLDQVEACLQTLLEFWGLCQDTENGSIRVREIWHKFKLDHFARPLPLAFQAGNDPELWRKYILMIQQEVFAHF